MELIEKMKTHASCLVNLVSHVRIVRQELVQCSEEWQEFLKALSAASPVCALVHPSSDVINLLERMQHTSITSDTASLRLLQQEVPVLFTLLESLPHYPRELLKTVLNRLVAMALAPFADTDPKNESSAETAEHANQTLSFFPQLYSGKHYTADKSISKICTKKSSGHPSLLPGIFTLFCQHGNVL